MDLEGASAGGNLESWQLAIPMQEEKIRWLLISSPILLLLSRQQTNVKTVTMVRPGTNLLPARREPDSR